MDLVRGVKARLFQGQQVFRRRAARNHGRPHRDRQEINWTIWGPSVPHIWPRPIERNHRRSRSTSRISRLRSGQRWGAIGHSKVQVISCRSHTISRVIVEFSCSPCPSVIGTMIRILRGILPSEGWQIQRETLLLSPSRRAHPGQRSQKQGVVFRAEHPRRSCSTQINRSQCLLLGTIMRRRFLIMKGQTGCGTTAW